MVLKVVPTFASERLTGPLLDHIIHHVHILEVNGENYGRIGPTMTP